MIPAYQKEGEKAMYEEYRNIYKAARESAGLTQERAAEALGISVESIRVYETDRRVPPNAVVSRMSDLYHSQFLIVQHVRNADDLAREFLPEPRRIPMPQASIRFTRLMRDFVGNGRIDTLLYFAEDGMIDAAERPIFEAIMSEWAEIEQAWYEFKMDR